MSETTKKMGRPRKKPEDRRDYVMQVVLTQAERDIIDDAARIAMKDETVPGRGKTSTWARRELLRLARRVVKRAGE